MSLSLAPRGRRVALLTAFSVVVAGLSFGGAAGTASADGPTTYPITGPDWATALTQIHSATSAEADGDVIQLDVDDIVDYSHAQTINFSQSSTLDLNGHTLQINQITISAGKTLTIEDSAGGGVINTDPDLYFTSPAAGIVVNSGESLVIDGGTIHANGAGQAHNGPGIGSGSAAAGSVTINGGDVYAIAGNSGAGVGGSNGRAGGAFTMTGGTLHATGAGAGAGIGGGGGGGAGASGGAVNISGGTIVATGAANASGIGGGSGGNSGNVTISDGTVTASGDATGIGSGNGSYSLRVSAGTFSMTGGDVTASATGSASSAGIGGGFWGSTGDIDIEGGTVHATGADTGAGIGSGNGAGAGDITIKNATVTATSANASAIGGSSGGAGSVGDILIGDGADVTASMTNPTQSIPVVGASDGEAYDSFELSGTLHVPTNNYLAVPSGSLLTIDSSGVLDGGGTILGSGTIANGGVIDAGDVWDTKRTDDHNTLTVTGNDYLVDFEPSAPNPGDANTETSERIYAPSFTALGSSLPALADEQGQIAQGWGASVDAGELWTNDTEFTEPTTTLYGLWDAVTSITLVAQSTSFGAGDNTGYEVIGTGSESENSDQTAWATVTSDTASDVIDSTAHTVTATAAGTHDIHASLASLTGGATLQNGAFFTVTAGDAGDPPVLAFLDAPTTAYPGAYFNYALTTTDSYGNPVSAVTTKVTTNVKGDTVKGSTVKFTKLGSHTITAKSGTVTKTMTTNVVKDQTAIDLTGSPITQAAGQTKSILVHLTPGLSNVTPVGKIRVYYGSKYVAATVKKASALSVKLPKFTKAGSYSIYVKYYGSGTYAPLTGTSFTYTVTPLAAVKLVFENPSTKGYLGDFPITLDTHDKYGNVVTADAAVQLSTPSSAVLIDGSDVAHILSLGKAVINASDGSLTATRKFTVVKDTPTIGALPGKSFDAQTESTLSVLITPVHSTEVLTGTVTLHFGSHAIVGNTTIDGSGSTATYTVDFDLPALPAGTYSTYITYSGDGSYSAVTTKKVKVKLVAGA